MLWITLFVLNNWSYTLSNDIFVNTGWSQTWFAISCPSLCALSIIPLCFSTFIHITKKVAFAFFVFNVSNSWGVNVPWGPSSKVSAISFWPSSCDLTAEIALESTVFIDIIRNIAARRRIESFEISFIRSVVGLRNIVMTAICPLFYWCINDVKFDYIGDGFFLPDRRIGPVFS